MDTAITTVHFITTFLLVGLVLMQQGKGAEMGVSMGAGGAQTVFGSTGGSLFGRITAVLAVLFFATSLGLALLAHHAAPTNLQAPAIERIDPSEPAEQAPAIEMDIPLSDLQDGAAEGMEPQVIEIPVSSLQMPTDDPVPDDSAAPQSIEIPVSLPTPNEVDSAPLEMPAE